MELATNEASQSAADNGTCSRGLRQSTGEKINVFHSPVDALQGSDGGSVDDVTQLLKSCDSRKSTEFAPLYVTRDSVISTMLNNLGSQI